MTKMVEPILMQNQEGALNQDTFAQAEFIRLKNEFNLLNAVETGTCLGYTTDFLAEHYNEVRTIEINQHFLDVAMANRLQNRKNVICLKGDSKDVLKNALRGMDDKTFIFLDAHWGSHCPLKEELDQISEAGIKPVIAIHDFFVPNHPELGFDSINGQPFTYEWLKPNIDKVYGKGKYKIHYNSESCGAKRGIIYITPM